MEMKHVSSSQVAMIGHDPATQIMRVQFVRGGVYEYEGVSPELHRSIVSANSIGGALRSNVKGLTYRKIS